MHGNNSDGRVCVLEVCAARDSPLANTVRQRLHDISSAERWTSRDHDLSKTSGRRSALAFFPPCSGFNVPISNGRRSEREKYIVYSCSLLVQKQLSFGDAHVVVECASDSLIPIFLRVTLDTFWRARIDLCMHGLVQPSTHLPIFRSVFVYTSSRVVFEALDRRCDGHRGLPHAVLTSESVRHVSFLSEQLVDLFVKIMVKTRIPLCVDDFLVAGCDDDPVFSAALSKLKGTFHWGTWNEDNFTLTGIEIETLEDGGFHLRQQNSWINWS